MDYSLEKSAQYGTLMQDLDQWNRLIDFFRGQLSEEDMKDRDFKKIQLKEFSRIIQMNQHRPLTLDERGYMAMLKFKREKLIRSIYPGLLTRLIYRTRRLMRDSIDIKRELEMAKQAEDDRIANPSIKLPKQQIMDSQAQSNDPSVTPANEHHVRYGPDFGGRKPSEHKQDGQSI